MPLNIEQKLKENNFVLLERTFFVDPSAEYLCLPRPKQLLFSFLHLNCSVYLHFPSSCLNVDHTTWRTSYIYDKNY